MHEQLPPFADDARHPILGMAPGDILEGVDEGIGSIVSLGDGPAERAIHRLAVFEIHDEGGQASVYVGIYLNAFEKHPDYDARRFVLNEREFSFLRFQDYGVEFRTAFAQLDRSYKRAFRVLKQRGRPSDAADVFNSNILHENVLRIEHFILDPDSSERYAYVLEAADRTLAEVLKLKDGAPMKDARHPRFLEHWIQVFRGLAAVHASSRFCADVSPFNTFVNAPDRADGLHTLKLGDFFANQATLEARVALHGWAGLNNPLIMAPEEFGLVLDSAADNQLADVYRMCAMLHDTVFGRYPVTAAWDDEQRVFSLKTELATRIREMQLQILRKRDDPDSAAEYEKREHRQSAEMRSVARDLVHAKSQYYEDVIQNTGRLDEQLLRLGVSDSARSFLVDVFQRGLAPHDRRLSASDILALYDATHRGDRTRRWTSRARSGLALAGAAATVAFALWSVPRTGGTGPPFARWQAAAPGLVSFVNQPEPGPGWRLPSASELNVLFHGMSRTQRSAFFEAVGLREPEYPVFFSADTIRDDTNGDWVIAYDLRANRPDTLHPLEPAFVLWVSE